MGMDIQMWKTGPIHLSHEFVFSFVYVGRCRSVEGCCSQIWNFEIAEYDIVLLWIGACFESIRYIQRALKLG